MKIFEVALIISLVFSTAATAGPAEEANALIDRVRQVVPLRT